MLENPQLTELNVRLKKIKDCLVYHEEAVQTDLLVQLKKVLVVFVKLKLQYCCVAPSNICVALKGHLL